MDVIERTETEPPPANGRSPLDRLRASAFWRSMFRQGYPGTEENRAMVMFNSFFLHIHPVKVKKHTLKISYSWGLGVIAAFLFFLLTITGGILMFLYVPSVDQAYQNMQDMETSVTFGMMLRNLHRWGAHLMVLVVFLHMCRVFFTGGYKAPREANWVVGVLLWLFTLLLSFTGYLLPYDQLSYWAITVSTNIAGYTPIIGEQARTFLLGAFDVGQAALQRFYGLHIFLLPTVVIVLMGIHFWRVRKDGGLSAPLSETAASEVADVRRLPPFGTGEPTQLLPDRPARTYGLMALMKRTSPMVEKGPDNSVFSWPHLMVMELLAILSTSVFLFVLSMFVNAPLRGWANPDVTENPAKAPWYFSNLQEILLHMSPALSGVIIPSLVILVLMAIPYVERRQDDTGIWFASRKGRVLSFWSAIYTTVALVALILFDEYVGVRQLVSSPAIFPEWIIPSGVMAALMAILYVGIKRWRPNGREIALAYFTAFVTTYIVTTISGQFFRGIGLHLTPVWNLPPGGLTF
ncbi:MAG: cytochrome b N-terminal domain-containing protein [Chloroflexi bacterium]|nr:cytochrome b N-terminal domain-containing protein [Chloroflexota bacterium]